MRSLSLPPDREEILKRILPEVRKYVLAYRSCNDKTEDEMLSVAYLTTTRAIRDYDPEKTEKLTIKDYVIYCVRNQLRRFDSLGRTRARARHELENPAISIDSFEDPDSLVGVRDPAPDESESLREQLLKKARTISPTMVKVIAGRIEGKTLAAIASEVGISDTHVDNLSQTFRREFREEFMQWVR